MIEETQRAPTIDLVEELTLYVTGVAIEVYRALQNKEPGTAIAAYVDSPSLKEAVAKFRDQLLENQVAIDRLQSVRGRPPHNSTLIRPAFFQALQECGFAEDQIIRAYDRFQAIYEPASKTTQAVRRFRTDEALQKDC